MNSAPPPDPIVLIHILLVVAGICTIVSAGMVLASGYLFFKACQNFKWSRLRPPEIARDHNGRPLRERI